MFRVMRISSQFCFRLASSLTQKTQNPTHFTAPFNNPCEFCTHSCPEPPVLSENLIHHLERTSLVDFNNAEAIERLSEAITFANQLFEVDTTGVEPLITVLENEPLPLRDDLVEPTSRKEVIMNASITEEDYFVAPPGNIPLEKISKDYLKSLNENKEEK